jgi:hypothetical protein
MKSSIEKIDYNTEKVNNDIEKLNLKIEKTNNNIKDFDIKISNVNKDFDSKISNLKKDFDSKITVLSSNLTKQEENIDSKKKNHDNTPTNEKSNEQPSEKKQNNGPENKPNVDLQQQNDTHKNTSVLQLKIESDSWQYFEKLLKEKKCEIKVPIDKIDNLKISINDQIQEVNYDKTNNSLSLKLDYNKTNQNTLAHCTLIFQIEKNKLKIKATGNLKNFLSEKICINIITEHEEIRYPLYFTEKSSITEDDIIFQKFPNQFIFTVKCSSLPNTTKLKLKIQSTFYEFKRNNDNPLEPVFYLPVPNKLSINEIIKKDPDSQLLLYIDNKERLSVPFENFIKK